MIDFDTLAAELLKASATATPVQLLTERCPELNWDSARAIARATDRLREANGDKQVGWKLGWTSQVMREALGVDRPNWGTLWQSQVADDSLPLKNFIHPKLEPELVWQASANLSGVEITAADVAASKGKWALGIEVVDPRFPSFDFDALDNTADNSSSAVVRFGSFHSLQDGVQLENLEVSLDDGSERRLGVGGQTMGSPFEAVAWLVRSLSAEGLNVGTGDIVFTGGLTAPFDAAAGLTYTLSSNTGSANNQPADELEAVTLNFF